MILSNIKNGHMSKLLMCVLALSMCLLLLIPNGLIESVSAEVTKETEVAIAGKASVIPKVDGELKEAVWRNAAWHEVANRQVATTLNNTCNFAVAWDKNNLYVAIKVVDGTIVTENLNESLYNNDGIEIFIDPKNVKEAGKYYDKTIHLFYQVADGAYEIWGGTGVWDKITEKYPNVKTAHVLTDDGYTVEVSFPFADLGIEKPNDGLIMGFEVTNNDDDNAASNSEDDRGVLYWNVATNAGSPATWGNLCLYNKAKPVVSNYGSAEIDGVLSDKEGWVFTSDAKHHSSDLRYSIASMCDDKYLYIAVDLKGTGLTDSAMELMIDPDNSKGTENEHIIQIIDYTFKTNTMKYSNPNVTSAAVGGENGYVAEFRIALEAFDYKPVYLDTVGMEIEMFTVIGDYSQPRVQWSYATTDSYWSKSACYGTIILNSLNVGGGNNTPPTGNQISSYSLAEGTKLSGKATITDPDGDTLTYRMDPNNKVPAASMGAFELNEVTGEWTYTPPSNVKMANNIVNYYIQADDGNGGTFHQRVEIRIEYKPTFKTYHVDGDTGKDTNDGLTPETALRTIQIANGKLRPGDTVIIHETEVPYCYALQQELIFSKSGLPEAYITYKAAEGEKPVINAGANWCTLKITGSYIILDGLTIEGIAKDFMPDMAENYAYYYQRLTGGGLHANVTKFNTNGISLSQENGKAPGDLGVDSVKIIHHVEIRNCVVDYLGSGGIGGSGCDYITIENNTITNCGWGDMWATSGISVLGCVDIDDNFDAHKIVIRNNITAGNRHFVPWITIKKFSDGNGIIIDSTDNTKTNKSLLEKGNKWGLQPYYGKFLVANNLSYFNGGSGIHAFDAANVDMINNTVYSNSSTPILGYNDFFSNASDNVNMYNNIVYSRTGAPENISSTSSSAVVYDNNLFYNYSSNNNLGKNIAGKNGKPGTTAGNNNIYGEDPLFANVYEVNYDTGIAYPDDWEDYMIQYAKDGGYFIGADYNVNILDFDFTLQEGSPALGSGNKEWSDKLGNTDNRMGIFGTIGSPMRPVVASDAVPATDRDLGELPKTEPFVAEDVKDNEKDAEKDTDTKVNSDPETTEPGTTDVEEPTDSTNSAIYWIIGAVVAVGVIVGLIFGLKKSKAKKNG